MTKFLVDANLPSKIKVWESPEFEFVNRINEKWTDSEIWDYATSLNLTIITKDADFSHRMIIANPPPRIIHIKIGNMRLTEFNRTIDLLWLSIRELSKSHKLVNVFADRIEAIE
jgi:Uncharacterized protein conserved in bacteria